jgi:hypothetical protein
MKAATPARAATKTEPWTLAADPVKVAAVGVDEATGALLIVRNLLYNKRRVLLTWRCEHMRWFRWKMEQPWRRLG